MYLVNPREQEKFYLRLLLLHVKGATSFKDIRTVDNVVLPNFLEAAKAKNLVSVDEEWDKCLNEACQIAFPKAICELFAYIYVFSIHLLMYENYMINTKIIFIIQKLIDRA